MSILQHYPSETNVDLEPLYRQAIADPNSLTRTEKNAIMRAPPPDIEDHLCEQHCGTNMATLYSKALNDPVSLTETEARVLADGANLPSWEEIKLDDRKLGSWPTSLQDLMWNACDAIATSEDNKVKSIANDLCRKFRQEKMRQKIQQRTSGATAAAVEASSSDSGKASWIKLLEVELSRGDIEKWGFVLFRTNYDKEEEWARLRAKIQLRAEQMIRAISGTASIAERFEITFVEDDPKTLAGANWETLHAQFTAMIDGSIYGGIRNGIRTDYFLSADDTVFRLFAVREATFEVPVWEAAFEPSHPLDDGYAGVVAMPVEKIISPLYGEIAEGRKPLRMLHRMAGG